MFKSDVLRIFALAVIFILSSSEAFIIRQTLNRHKKTATDEFLRSLRPTASRVSLTPIDTESSFPTLVVAEQTWRQYVSLVVITGVLIDILLGSPLANMVLKPMRNDANEEKNDGDDENGPAKMAAAMLQKSKERVDSESVAQAALDKAQNALELRRFLEESKTDWDRMEDIKRKLDSEMQSLDADLQTRQESLTKRQDLE